MSGVAPGVPHTPLVDTTAADRIPNLRTNKVDLIIGQFTRNAERAKVVTLSFEMMRASLYVATPAASTRSERGAPRRA